MYLKFQFQWSSAGVLCVGALERLERIRVGFFPAMASHHSSALAAHCSKVWMDQCSWNRFAKVLCELYSNKDTDLCAVGYVNISICQMCTGCHCHPASAFLLGECAPSSLLGCGISAERAGTLLLPDTALQPPAYGGWHAELWHFLCVLRARKPKCCGVAGFVDYTHLYVCAMCTPTSPLRKAPPGSVALCPALSPVLLLWRLWTDVSLFPCPCSPALLERGPGRSWAAQFFFAGAAAAGGWVEGKKDSANAFPLLPSIALWIYTWALVSSVPWLKNKQLFRWASQVL